jgi:hypothetical protein
VTKKKAQGMGFEQRKTSEASLAIGFKSLTEHFSAKENHHTQ